MSLIEVIVGALIFALIAMGVAVGMATSLKMTADTSGREAAVALASSEIDAVRLIDDPFKVFSSTYSKTVDKIAYTVKRDVAWVQGAGTSEGCRPGSSASAGVSSLQFKRVNVSVTWSGSIGASSTVRSDTVLAPKSRLSDPAKGTILVSVVGADGTPRSGVSISASGPGSLANPASTDADGCSYLLMVTPGTWTIGASRAGYVGMNQASSQSATATVTAGSTASVAFQLDAQSTLSPVYPTGTVAPVDLDLNFFSTYGVYSVGGRPAGVPLHPFTSGYTLVAGRYSALSSDGKACLSSDPTAWAAGTVNGKNLAAGSRLAPVSTPPGGNAQAPVAMGVIAGDTPFTTVRIIAVAPPAGVGDPGCTANPPTYTYRLAAPGPAKLAVPFGSWRLEVFDGQNWFAVNPSSYTVPSNAAGEIDSANNTTTVDPRGLAQ